MDKETAKIDSSCPRETIAAYVDGELSPREEMELELHFADCPECTAELNDQKRLLCVLDYALEDEGEIELPENFTRVVVANAESRVSGLRCPRERTWALMIVTALILLIVAGLGGESNGAFASAGAFADRFIAVGGFFVHLIQDLVAGATVVLRTLCFQYVLSSTATVMILGLSFLLSILALSRLVFKHGRS